MMKKIFTATAIAALMASCGGATNTNENKKAETTQEVSKPTKLIEEIDGYFVTYKPKFVEVLVQNKTDFEANFNVAKTMDNEPTAIDFDMHKVGAIVAPETAVETEIVINSTSVEDRKLVVDYSINHKGEERSFTILPMKAFLFPLTLDIDSVSFVNNSEVTTLVK